VFGPSPVEPAVLAIDGGSSKTDAVLVAGGGAVLGRARVGPSNHQHMGVGGAVTKLGEAVAAVARDAGFDDASLRFPLCSTGVYCLAGIDLPVDEDLVAPAIAAQGWTTEVILRNDAIAVYRAGATRDWGVGVVCGTGLNCAAVGPDGSIVRFPALEELSGDVAAGGSWLGVRALGLAIRAGDGRGEPTILRQTVPASLGQPDAEAVLSAVHTGALSRERLFALAQVLLDAAADGDAPARAAADVLADEIVTFVRAAIERLGVEHDPVEVVLGGGVFNTHDERFHRRIDEGIHAVAPRAELVRLGAPPVLGAALMGLDAIGASPQAHDTLRAACTAT
jgi:N-acetylglucosamine kinase-like BadF-type ATPase